MIELRHFDVRHYVIEECRHLANGCTTKMGLHRFDINSISTIMLYAIIRDINTIGFVSAYAALVASCATFTRRLHCPSDKMDVLC